MRQSTVKKLRRNLGGISGNGWRQLAAAGTIGDVQ